MTTIDADVVDDHLTRLSSSACRAFVADLWAARGFETRVEDDVVVASRHGGETVLFPACGGRLRSPPAPTRQVDVVVAPAHSSKAATLAARHDARLLDAGDLREMLRYAVSAPTAAALCERHLGAAPSALEPSAWIRTRRQIAQLRTANSPRSSTVTVLLLVVVVAAGVATFGFGGNGAVENPATSVSAEAEVAAVAGGDVGDSSASTTSTAGDAMDGTSSLSTTRRSSGRWQPVDTDAVSSVPGMNASGMTNVTALAAAHDRALGTQSYTIWADTYRPYNGVPSAEQAQRDTDIAVAGDRYLVRESLERGNDRRLVRAVYYDGADWYIDDRSTTERTLRWVDGSGDDASVEPDPRTLRTALVTYYLDTQRTNVTGSRSVDGVTHYRVEGSGAPPPFAVQEVYNYEFVAIVDERGFVRDGRVTYTVVRIEGSYQLRFEWTYDRLNTTTVAEPAWVEEARPPTTATANRTTTATANRTTTSTANRTTTATANPTTTP